MLVPLGGFLGAGKTTLILAAARVLSARGLRPAAILNDQGAELVDTRFVRANGLDAEQVAGGCFCCRFSELVESAERLRAHAPDVIFAEAVGSCTDISATTLQPLKLGYGGRFRLAAYSVLVDPRQAQECMAQDAASDWSFLFHKQIEEADLVCYTKTDLHGDFPALTGAPVRYLSAATGQGVAEWLDEVLAGEREAGGRILDLDYPRYARAEAIFAWLNSSATVRLRNPLSPSLVIGPLLEALDAALTAGGLRIAHLKVVDSAPTGYVKASIVRNGEEPSVYGMLDASPAARHELLLNVRAAGEPAALQRVVEKQMASLPGKVEVRSLECFRPSAPVPERRLDGVVSAAVARDR